MNNQKLVTLTLTRRQVVDTLFFLSTMDGDLELSEIEELHYSIKNQLDLFDYNSLCCEIRLKSYLPYVKIINGFCAAVSAAPTRILLWNYRVDALNLLNSWTFLPDSISSYLLRKIRRSYRRSFRRLRHLA